MSAQLKDHIRQFTDISDQEFNSVLPYFESRQVAKKEILIKEGQICRHHYFVAKGLLRKYFINEKGTEQTTEFAIENWWVTDNKAYEHQQPTSFYIQAVEKSEILLITQKNQEQMLEAVPAMERYFRFVYQRAYAATQMRIKYLFSLSKEAFYSQLLEQYPEFVQRVPQYLIASFLGFTPEYLSEIRKRGIS